MEPKYLYFLFWLLLFSHFCCHAILPIGRIGQERPAHLPECSRLIGSSTVDVTFSGAYSFAQTYSNEFLESFNALH